MEDKLITILGDSLAMTRYWDGINYKDTYSYKLSKYLGNSYYVYNKSKRANYITKQVKEIFDDILPDSDYYVIQIGIVDCAPRVFGPIANKIIDSIKFKKLQKLITSTASKYRKQITKAIPKTYVTRKKYRRGFTNLINILLTQTQVKKIYIINIADTLPESKITHYNYEKNIMDYNAILENVARANAQKVEILDLHELTKADNSLLLHDGHHISKEAHTLIAKLLIDKIKQNEEALN